MCLKIAISPGLIFGILRYVVNFYGYGMENLTYYYHVLVKYISFPMLCRYFCPYCMIGSIIAFSFREIHHFKMKGVHLAILFMFLIFSTHFGITEGRRRLSVTKSRCEWRFVGHYFNFKFVGRVYRISYRVRKYVCE